MAWLQVPSAPPFPSYGSSLERRAVLRRAWTVPALLIVVVIAILVVLGAAYTVKCSLGIDLIEGVHLGDLFR